MLSDTKAALRRKQAQNGEQNYTNWEMASTLDRSVTILFFTALGLLPGALIAGFCESRNASGEYLTGVRPGFGFWVMIVIGTLVIELLIIQRLFTWYADRPYERRFKQPTVTRTRS